MTDIEHEEKFEIAFEKWQNGEELTLEEEQMILDEINKGDTMMGATT